MCHDQTKTNGTEATEPKTHNKSVPSRDPAACPSSLRLARHRHPSKRQLFPLARSCPPSSSSGYGWRHNAAEISTGSGVRLCRGKSGGIEGLGSRGTIRAYGVRLQEPNQFLRAWVELQLVRKGGRCAGYGVWLSLGDSALARVLLAVRMPIPRVHACRSEKGAALFNTPANTWYIDAGREQNAA